MTITTAPIPEEQPESIPAPVEPPSTPAPETVEPPVSAESTQPADAVTAEQTTPVTGAPVTVTVERQYGGPMIVKPAMTPNVLRAQLDCASGAATVNYEATADLRVETLERMLAKSEAARKHLVTSVKAWASRAVVLQTRRDRILRQSAAYRKARDAKPAPVAAPVPPTDWRLKLDTAQQALDTRDRDLAKLQQRVAQLEREFADMRENRDHYQRMYTREREWNSHTHVKVAVNKVQA